MAARKDQEPCRSVSGPEAHAFELRQSDTVVLIGSAQIRAGEVQNTRLDITYTIEGIDPAAAAADALASAFPKRIPGEPEAARTREVTEITMTVAISDRLRPDGRLVTKFERIQTKDNTPSVQSSRTLVFRVRDEYPFFAATFGIVASRSREPEIAIVNSSTVITFERDGQEQRGFEQMIVVRDAEERFRPLGSVATFLNFRVWQRLYAAPGFRLDRQAFEEPLVGVSWFQKLGTIGIAFTGGVHFTRELEIIESSGFRDGQRLEPTLGLTADAIPAEERRHSRLFLSVSFKY